MAKGIYLKRKFLDELERLLKGAMGNLWKAFATDTTVWSGHSWVDTTRMYDTEAAGSRLLDRLRFGIDVQRMTLVTTSQSLKYQDVKDAAEIQFPDHQIKSSRAAHIVHLLHKAKTPTRASWVRTLSLSKNLCCRDRRQGWWCQRCHGWAQWTWRRRCRRIRWSRTSACRWWWWRCRQWWWRLQWTPRSSQLPDRHWLTCAGLDNGPQVHWRQDDQAAQAGVRWPWMQCDWRLQGQQQWKGQSWQNVSRILFSEQASREKGFACAAWGWKPAISFFRGWIQRWHRKALRHVFDFHDQPSIADTHQVFGSLNPKYTKVMVLDTACQKSCCSTAWLDGKKASLAEINLRVRTIPNSGPFEFRHGPAQDSHQHVQIPVCFDEDEKNMMLIGASFFKPLTTSPSWPAMISWPTSWRWFWTYPARKLSSGCSTSPCPPARLQDA